MATPKMTTLPASVRDAAAIEAEKVVEFDEGDFYREVDAVTPILAAYFIEQGAKAAAAAMGLHFCNDDSESFVPGISTEDIGSFATSAVADVMRAAGLAE